MNPWLLVWWASGMFISHMIYRNKSKDPWWIDLGLSCYSWVGLAFIYGFIKPIKFILKRYKNKYKYVKTIN